VNHSELDFLTIYTRFQSPVTTQNCSEHCAPYNELGIPFCCDSRHTISTAYLAEWDYLRTNSDLWRQWEGRNQEDTMYLRSQTPDGHVLIACLGYKLCNRQFRSFVCRAFPFFPYVTIRGQFIGLTYYWEYEDRCWVINNLQLISSKFVAEFIAAFDEIFKYIPQEKENYRYHSSRMRRSFSIRHRAIPLLHRDGHVYEVTPRNGNLQQVSVTNLPRFGPYKIADEMPFPDEMNASMQDSDS